MNSNLADYETEEGLVSKLDENVLQTAVKDQQKYSGLFLWGERSKVTAETNYTGKGKKKFYALRKGYARSSSSSFVAAAAPNNVESRERIHKKDL